MSDLSHQQEESLYQLLSKLIDQNQAKILIPANRAESGYWFGGGNVVQDPTGVIWLSGRYRNYGDSRTGLKAGQRGLECAIFRSEDGGKNFTKVRSWSKADLSYNDNEVLSIEGTALHMLPDGTWEFFVSSEKALQYPRPFADFQKPGTGIWTIDRMTGGTIEGLDPGTLTLVLGNHGRPEYLHLKDAVVYDDPYGNTVLLFTSHPFTWASGNTGMALRVREEEKFEIRHWEIVSRGSSWDVAVTRITCRLPIPDIGCFSEEPPASVYFYDGAECMRAHQESPLALERPRGYSCEELGGAFFGWDAAPLSELKRLSTTQPLFVSPWGTGSSRYVDVVMINDGILAVWQQSQRDLSQPLVANFLPMEEVDKILSGG